MHIISNYILGVSGGNGIQEALRIAIGPFLSLRLFSFLLFLNGVWLYLLFLVFPFLGCLIIVLWFLDVFASFVHFLCTGLCFFNKLLNYLSKTKTKNYIPLPRVIHPSYISRDDFDFIDTIVVKPVLMLKLPCKSTPINHPCWVSVSYCLIFLFSFVS